MFTGLITDVGTVRAATPAGSGRDLRFEIETAYDLASVSIGASIACSGACLTVVAHHEDRFAVEVSAETLRRTTLGRWTVGSRINLERSLTAATELGGHIVTGHVDGVGRIVERTAVEGSQRYLFDMPSGLARFVAEKGSIAIEGVSLTVNSVTDDGKGHRFEVNIIRHTREMTTFSDLDVGDPVNIEVDILARYVDRQIALGHMTGR